MKVYIVYFFFGPVLIKFNKGDIHKNLLGISSFMQDGINQCFSIAGLRPGTRYQALASIIPGHKKFSWKLS
jgi:hypothetical protein